MVSSVCMFMSRQILVIFVVSYFTENEYFTQLWFLLLRVITDHTWSQACAGATFPHPCEIAAHTHGIGINASNYMLLDRYHVCMYIAGLLKKLTKSQSGKFEIK